MPYYSSEFDEDGHAIEGSENYVAAEVDVPLVDEADDCEAWGEIREALLEAGYSSVVIRYDGGHDEGFSHFHRAERPDGANCAVAAVAAEFLRGPLARLAEAPTEEWRSTQTPQERMGWALDEFTLYPATEVLGEGFGTGECTVRGWFRFDLATGLAVDLPFGP
jgi:hypothetical protein